MRQLQLRRNNSGETNTRQEECLALVFIIVTVTNYSYRCSRNMRVSGRNRPPSPEPTEIGDFCKCGKCTSPRSQITCLNCDTNTSLYWRKGPDPNSHLCGPCGGWFRVRGTHRPPDERRVIHRQVDPVDPYRYSVTTVSAWSGSEADDNESQMAPSIIHSPPGAISPGIATPPFDPSPIPLKLPFPSYLDTMSYPPTATSPVVYATMTEATMTGDIVSADPYLPTAAIPGQRWGGNHSSQPGSLSDEVTAVNICRNCHTLICREDQTFCFMCESTGKLDGGVRSPSHNNYVVKKRKPKENDSELNTESYANDVSPSRTSDGNHRIKKKRR